MTEEPSLGTNYSPAYQDITDPWKKNSWAYLNLIGQDREWTPTRIPRSVSSNTTVNRLDDLVMVDCSGGDVTITLETAVGADGRPHTIMKSDSSANSVIVDANGSETINGAATYEISPRQYAGVHIKARGGNWVMTGVAVANWAPAGLDTQVQYNDGGFFGASADLTYTEGTNTTAAHTLTVTTGDLTVTPGSITTGNTTDLSLKTSGGTQGKFVHVATAVNQLEFRGSVTTAAVSLRAGGTDTNINVNYEGKSGATTTRHRFYKNTTQLYLDIAPAGTAGTAYATLLSAAGTTPSAPTVELGLAGAAAIDWAIWKAGTGSINFCHASASNKILMLEGADTNNYDYLKIKTTGTSALRIETIAVGTHSGSLTTNLPAGTAARWKLVAGSGDGPRLDIVIDTADGTPDDYLRLTPGGTGADNHTITLEAINNSAGPASSMLLKASGTGTIQCSNGFIPRTNDGAALGVSGTAWSDLFLASTGVINWNAGDVTITHAANTLSFAGAASGYNFDANVIDSVTSGFYWYGARGAARVSLRI